MHTNTASVSAKAKLRALTWGLPLMLAMLPIGLLSVYSYRIASDSVRSIIRAEDMSQTGGIGVLLQQDIGKTVSLAEAFGSAQGTLKALAEDDSLALMTRLKALTLAFPALGSAAIADTKGLIIASYPTHIGSSGNTAEVELVEKTIASGKPQISEIHESPTGSGIVVSVAAPMFGSGTTNVVILRYRTEQMSKWFSGIDIASGSSLFILDHHGKVVARAGIREADVAEKSPEVRKALEGTLHTSEYADPHGSMMVGTFLPVSIGKNTWVIIAEKPTSVAYRDLERVRTNIALAGGFLTLVTLCMVITLARTHARNIRLNNELKDKNLKLQETAAIVQSSNDAIVGFMRDGKIRTWNAAAEKIFGWKSDDIMSQSVAMIIPKEKRDEFAELLTKVNAGETIQNFETIRQKKDGTIVPVSVTLSPIRDEHKNVVAVSSIDRDTTERKRIEQMKDDFISFVSHQLKAPITAIRWTLESIVDGDYGDIPEKMKQPLEEIRGVNVQNFQLVNDILNASRIDRGVIAVETKPMLLSEVITRSLRDYTVAIKKAGLTLTVIDAPEPLTVLVDLEKAAESVTNSLSNSIKHTKTGGLTVRSYRDGDFGCIDVSDTGEGMPQNIIDKLFTRTGILGTNTVAEKSAGLGLYIAKHFMEIQNGEIRVTSTVGKGTTFTYRLPLAKANT